MSSAYRALCLSHDPALTIPDAEWRDAVSLQGALADPAACEALAGHTACDLLGGRYSYPLIEVYCPPTRDTSHHPHAGVWIDVEWLRLLLAAYDRTADVEVLSRPLSICWSRQRITRLRRELAGGD